MPARWPADLLRLLVSVAGGQQVRAEMLGHHEFALHRIAQTI